MSDTRLTDQQRRHIFAAGRERGLDIHALRAMTPAGSISMLTRPQAAQLIDALRSGRSPDYGKRSTPSRRRDRKPAGVIRLMSDAQRNLIASLRIELGWTPAGLKAWLKERHFPGERRDLTDMQKSSDAAFVIELLKQVRNRSNNRGQRNAANTASASA